MTLVRRQKLHLPTILSMAGTLIGFFFMVGAYKMQI